MSTEFYGLQMDAEHEVEEYSDVSEMTQMISAFIENGFSKDIVDQIYRDIGECALTALQDCLDAFKMPTEQEQRSAISKILGEAYIKSMEGKDTIGLAQAFIQRAQQGLKDLSVIPVSAASISDSFISTVANLITKRGIRRKYAGFAGVQTPSYNMIQYYNVGKGTGLYRHFAEEVKDRLLAGGMSLEQFTRGYQYDIISAPLKDGDITTLEAFNKNDVITPRYEEDSVDPKFYRGKPLPKAMAHGLGITGTDYRENIALTTEDGRRIIPDVHIEDTVTWLEAIETESGVYYVAHSKRFKTYEDIDNFKTLCLNGGCVAAYKNLAAPHNLRGRTILMTGADGSKYDHFDINSVRALYAFNNSEADGNPLVFNALINLFDDVNNPEDQMYFDFLSQLTGGKLGVLQKLKYHEDPLTAEELALLTPEEVANCELALYNIAYDKKIRAHVAKLMERKVQQDLRAIKNGQDVVFRNGLNTIVEHKNLPGEIITGRVGSAKFGLSKSVDLNKIKDAESFKAAIRQSGEKISGKHGCDASVMLPNGENLLFKVCNPMLSKTSGNYVYTSYDE